MLKKYLNADPYENLESLQAQERSLGENNVVYTQTIEIISEEEFDAESSQRDNHTNKTKQDTLSKLLDNLPLNDINQTILVYILGTVDIFPLTH